MPALLVEIGYPPRYIEERWRIEIKQKFNMPKNAIIPQESQKPGSAEIKALIVGREVQKEQIEAFFKGYFYGKGLWERIVRMQFV